MGRAKPHHLSKPQLHLPVQSTEASPSAGRPTLSSCTASLRNQTLQAEGFLRHTQPQASRRRTTLSGCHTQPKQYSNLAGKSGIQLKAQLRRSSDGFECQLKVEFLQSISRLTKRVEKRQTGIKM